MSLNMPVQGAQVIGKYWVE